MTKEGLIFWKVVLGHKEGEDVFIFKAPSNHVSAEIWAENLLSEYQNRDGVIHNRIVSVSRASAKEKKQLRVIQRIEDNS